MQVQLKVKLGYIQITLLREYLIMENKFYFRKLLI